MQKNRDIQVLRGIAIMLVLVQHCRNRLPTPEAYHRVFDHVAFWPGVDVFFAISGFLIFQTFTRTMEASSSRTQALYSFVSRRLTRLFPAVLFWVTLSVLLAMVLTTAPYGDPLKVLASGAAALVALSNLYYVACLPDVASCGNPDFNGVTWSLSAEWQMYLMLAVSMLFFGRTRAVTVLLSAAAIMSVFDAPSWSGLWAFRTQAFALGALTALIAERAGGIDLGCWRSITLLMLGIAIVISAPAKLPQPFVLPAIGMGAWACLVSAMGGNSFTFAISAPLHWIGERSYSIYLCHLLVLLSAREALTRLGMMDTTPLHVALGFGVSLATIAVLGDLSYKHIELRFHRPEATPTPAPRSTPR